jgi:hypothetical protein
MRQRICPRRFSISSAVMSVCEDSMFDCSYFSLMRGERVLPL